METGILEEREVESRSEPGTKYRMVRTPGGWQHADSGCPAWGYRGSCRHVEELMSKTESAALVPLKGALATIEELEDTAIVNAIRGQVSPDWVYSFRQAGALVEDLSVVGVEAAGRECAKRGEAIRELDIRIDSENDYEARFVAQAARHAVGADGQEVLLDTAIRAKRQSKWIRLTPEKAKERGVTHVFNEHWYEVGIAKALRNAKKALLPQDVKTVILAEAREAGHIRQVDGERRRRSRPPSPAERQAAAQPIAPDMKSFMSAARSLGFADDVEILAALDCRNLGDIESMGADEAFTRLRDIAMNRAQTAADPESAHAEAAPAEAGRREGSFDGFLRVADKLKEAGHPGCDSRSEVKRTMGWPENDEDVQTLVRTKAHEAAISEPEAWLRLGHALIDIVRLMREGDSAAKARNAVAPMARLKQQPAEGEQESSGLQ